MLKKLIMSVGLSLMLYHPASVLAVDDEDGGLACGSDQTCDAQTQYCSVVVGGPMGRATGYTCIDVSDAPLAPSCETINVPIGSECSETEEGVVVTTQAP